MKSENGQIRFNSDNQGEVEATLNATGLGVGLTPQSNLHIAGNGIISEKMSVGGSVTENSLHIQGTMALMPLTSSGGNVTLDQNSLLLINTSSLDGSVTLPSPSSATGRMIKIKKLSSSGNLYIASSGNLIDLDTTLSIPEDTSADLASLTLVSDGSQWWLLSYSGPATEVVGGSNLFLSYKFNETAGSSVSDDSGNSRTASLTNSHDFSGNSIS